MLEDLHHIRLELRVWIHWDIDMECLVIRSRPWPHPQSEKAQENVIEAINAIRQDLLDAKARKVSATPLYIVVPPSTQAMRNLFRPVKYQKLNMIEPAGTELSSTEKEKWSRHRIKLLVENTNSFTSHIVKHLRALAPLKQWMQMRVHFGHLNMRQWPRDFTSGGSFTKLHIVLNDPRTQANSSFDKVLPDAKRGKEIGRRIIANPEIFTSFYGINYALEEVEFSHMLCVFLKTSHRIPVRLEVDIDRNAEDKYQLGSMRYFRDNNRNKLVEVCNVDIER
jgi:hypothetical protein